MGDAVIITFMIVAGLCYIATINRDKNDNRKN